MRKTMKPQFALLALAAIGCFLFSQSVAENGSHHSGSQPKPVIGLIDEVQELYPDTKLDKPVKRLTVHSSRNTRAGVLVMMTGLQGIETVAFSESGNGGRLEYEPPSRIFQHHCEQDCEE